MCWVLSDVNKLIDQHMCYCNYAIPYSYLDEILPYSIIFMSINKLWATKMCCHAKQKALLLLLQKFHRSRVEKPTRSSVLFFLKSHRQKPDDWCSNTFRCHYDTTFQYLVTMTHFSHFKLWIAKVLCLWFACFSISRLKTNE